jgi:hypothetical protein
MLASPGVIKGFSEPSVPLEGQWQLRVQWGKHFVKEVIMMHSSTSISSRYCGQLIWPVGLIMPFTIEVKGFVSLVILRSRQM